MQRVKKSVSIGDTGESWKSLMQLDWGIPVNTDNFVEPLKDNGIEAIHNNATRILEEIGIKIFNREACSILEKAVCTVDHSSFNMRMDRHWVMEMIEHTLTKFSITPRNEAKKLQVGKRTIVFGNVSSSPNSLNLDRGKQPENFENFKDFMKLTQFFNCIHFAGGYTVEPKDINPS